MLISVGVELVEDSGNSDVVAASVDIGVDCEAAVLLV